MLSYPYEIPASYRPRIDDSRFTPAHPSRQALGMQYSRPVPVVKSLPARDAGRPVAPSTGLKASLQSAAAAASHAAANATHATQKAFARLPHEPDDAKMTGVTRSLHRRLLALNIGGSLSPQHAA